MFLGLEKSRSRANSINTIKTNDTERKITGPSDVLAYLKDHFQNLYAKNEDVNNVKDRMTQYLENVKHPTITQEHKELCDANLTVTEIGDWRGVNEVKQRFSSRL